MDLARADRRERLDRLAAEYALGTLPPRARRRLGRAARADGTVAAALRAWEWRLAALAEDAPGVTPPPRVWNAIGDQLGLHAAPTRRKTPWWGRLAVWRGLAIASTVAAVGLAGALLVGRMAPPESTVVVVLAPSTGAAALVAMVAPGADELVARPLRALDVPAGRALELWALPEGRAPRSLGLIAPSGAGRLAVPAATLRNVTELAVSLEPAGGSPSGAPTGPVLFTGRVERMR